MRNGSYRLRTGLMGDVIRGDIREAGHTMDTVGLVEIPPMLKLHTTAVTLSDSKSLDLETGRLLEFKRMDIARGMVVNIQEYGEYSVKDLIPEWILRNGDIIKMYEVMHGGRFNPKSIEPKKLHVVEALERYINGEITYSDFQKFIVMNFESKRVSVASGLYWTSRESGSVFVTSAPTYYKSIKGDNTTYYVERSRLAKIKGNRVRAVVCGYSVDALIREKDTLLSEGVRDLSVGDKVSNKDIIRLRSQKESGINISCIQDDSRVFLMSNDRMLGIVTDSLALHSYLKELDVRGNYYKNLVNASMRRVEEVLRDEIRKDYNICKLGAKLVRGDTLTRGEEILAAKITYGYGGWFNYIGFGKG